MGDGDNYWVLLPISKLLVEHKRSLAKELVEEKSDGN